MKRDMDLSRKILLKIEEEYVSTAILNLVVENYSMEQIAIHCELLHEAGFISYYNAQYGGDSLDFFAVGNLTWNGYEYLDKIRDDSIWKKVKDTAKEQGLPLVFDTVKQLATVIISSMMEGAIKGMR